MRQYITISTDTLNAIVRRANDLGRNQTRVLSVTYIPPQTPAQDPEGVTAWELDHGPTTPSQPGHGP